VKKHMQSMSELFMLAVVGGEFDGLSVKCVK